jgi:hypothetical protein
LNATEADNTRVVAADAPDAPSAGTRDEHAIVRILVGAAAVELSLFVWFIAIGRKAFIDFVWTPDTPSYIRVAQQLAERHTLAEGTRTLGYPMIAAVA